MSNPKKTSKNYLRLPVVGDVVYALDCFYLDYPCTVSSVNESACFIKSISNHITNGINLFDKVYHSEFNSRYTFDIPTNYLKKLPDPAEYLYVMIGKNRTGTFSGANTVTPEIPLQKALINIIASRKAKAMPPTFIVTGSGYLENFGKQRNYDFSSVKMTDDESIKPIIFDPEKLKDFPISRPDYLSVPKPCVTKTKLDIIKKISEMTDDEFKAQYGFLPASNIKNGMLNLKSGTGDKIKPDTCTKKTAFATEKIANAYLKQLARTSTRKKFPTRSYLCTTCLSWHVTSKTVNQFDQEKNIQATLQKRNKEIETLKSNLTKKTDEIFDLKYDLAAAKTRNQELRDQLKEKNEWIDLINSKDENHPN